MVVFFFIFYMNHICKTGRWFYVRIIRLFKTTGSRCCFVAVNLPSESSSSSSASFSRTSAGRVIPTAGVGSNIIVSSPVEVLSAMVVRQEPRQRSAECQVKKATRVRRKMGLKTIPPQSVLAEGGEQGVAVSPVSLQRRTDV